MTEQRGSSTHPNGLRTPEEFDVLLPRFPLGFTLFIVALCCALVMLEAFFDWFSPIRWLVELFVWLF